MTAGNTIFREDFNLLFGQDLAVVLAKLLINAGPASVGVESAQAGVATSAAASPAGTYSVAECDRQMLAAGRLGAAQSALHRHVPDLPDIGYGALISFFGDAKIPAAVKRVCFWGGVSHG